MSSGISSMQRTPRLPPELIDHILNHLQHSTKDLRNCALVCKSWLASCRFHLFHHVEIDRNAWSFIKSLYNAIQISPDIAFCVQKLSFSTVYIPPEEEAHVTQLLGS